MTVIVDSPREQVQRGIAEYVDSLLAGDGWVRSGAEAAAHIMRHLVDPYVTAQQPAEAVTTP